MDHTHLNAADDHHNLPMTLNNSETQDSDSDSERTLSESNSPSPVIEIDQDSDFEAESESPDSDRFEAFTKNEMMTLVEKGLERETVTKRFVSGMGAAGRDTRVVAVHKNSNSGVMRKARFDSFRVFTEAVAKKCGGNPNIKYAWFGGSRDEIAQILVHGFSAGNEVVKGRIQLVPVSFALDAAVGSCVDEDGMRHLLMCRVIMGKSELMPNGYNQVRPDSSEFDSGVDSLAIPRKYFVWSESMNSHICPAYVVSFKAPDGLDKYAAPPEKHYDFLHVLPVLSRFLQPSKMAFLYQLCDDYKDKKISFLEFLRILKRQVDGKIMEAALKSVKPRDRNDGASPAPGTVNLPDLMKVLPQFLPASKMEVLEKLCNDHFAKKISLAELNRRVRLVVDRKVMVDAIKLMKATGLKRGALLLTALSRFLPPAQMKILAGLVKDFRAKKISGDEMDRKFKLMVDEKVLASALKLVTPSTSTKQRGNTGSYVRDLFKEPKDQIYFPALLSELEGLLPPRNMALLTKSLEDLKAKKITRAQLIKRTRLLVGNELLVAAIKSYESKQQNV